MNKAKPGFFYGWYIVIASWLMVFLQSSIAVGVFFKPILDEFKWDRATLSSVQAIGLLAFTAISPFLGRLLDKVGPRIMMSISACCQIASACLNSFAASIWYLYIARFFFGITIYPNTQVLINKWFFKLRGTALGIVSSAMPIGTLILTPISQFLILTWNWRITMLFWACIMVVVMIPLLFIIRNQPADKGLNPDGAPDQNTLAGSVLLNKGAKSANNTMPFFTTSRAARTASFWLLAGCQFACGIGCGFMMTHIIIFATDVGFSEMIGASLLSVQGGFNFAGVLILGYLSDKMIRKNILSLTHFIRFIAFALLIVFTMLADNSLWLLYTAMAFFGIGWFTTAPLTAGVAADLFGDRRLGTILGILTGFHMLGMAIGAFIGGAIFDANGSYLSFFLIQCPLEFIAVILAFMIKQKKLVIIKE